MEFVSKKIDLEIKITTISGDEKTMKVPHPLSAKEAGLYMDAIVKGEKEWQESHADKDSEGKTVGLNYVFAEAVELMDEHLSSIYGTEKGFWMDNVDTDTIIAIKKYVVGELSNTKKN